MKVKIEFEVNGAFDKTMRCIHSHVDTLYYELIDIDDNFNNISIEIKTKEKANESKD